MTKNPLRKLESYGQSIWMDFIRRGTINSGELKKWIEEDGVSGVTSNPSIFEKAIGGSHDYDHAIHSLAIQGASAEEIYQAVTVEDIQMAVDLFRPQYDRLGGQDGFVSIEVSPHLAHDTEGTIAEAHRLWDAVNRPNLMVKVPATREGIPAIRQLLADGLNINITLLFGLPRYRDVIEAYLSGLVARVDRGQPVERIASVASFFLSRIDVLVDPLLEKIIQTHGEKSALAQRLHGQVAIASAKAAYRIFQEQFASSRFQKLAAQGARPQRLLWASTSTKNPAYSDVKYVEALIGPQTINTLPVETLDAYRDHGQPEPRLTTGIDQAQDLLDLLHQLGIDLAAVTQQLEDEGVAKFNKSFDQLMHTLQDKRAAALKEPLDRQAFELGRYQQAVNQRRAALEEQQFTTRIWKKDPALWKPDEKNQAVICNALGWLYVAEKMEENLKELVTFADEIRDAGFRHVVDMGMGGSSLTPIVFERIFSPGEKGLPLTILDTTQTGTLEKIAHQVPLEQTLFIVASKSGTTAEPLALGDYFYTLVQQKKGDRAGDNFIVITDPDTPLVRSAQDRGYRRVFFNYADIGGRYSALSYFGLLPAVLLGIDVEELLARALRMQHACSSCVPAEENPGLQLGAVLGELGRQGRNKVTFVMPLRLQPLGMWLEQLLAESTGKDGTGLLPVAGEALGDPAVYGDDRLFVHYRFASEQDDALENGVVALQTAGQPIISIVMQDYLDLGQEFFRWEFATAVAGSILGINAFDQPNVQESKDNTNRLLAEVQEQGRLPEQQPALTGSGLSLFGRAAGATVEEALHNFIGQARPGDYIALLAYLEENPETNDALEKIRLSLRDRTHLATTVGYGPRYLHSTGQFHKGGPNTGLFIELTQDEPDTVQIPGKEYSFGKFNLAQAQGDFESLHKHGRRVIRIHLGDMVKEGLAQVNQVFAGRS